MPGAAERTLVVEARDLDTDERSVDTITVDMPVDDAGQRAQFARVVARLHPDAQMRSFGGGAASFLDSQRLIVAHYALSSGAEPATASLSGPPAQVEQQSLFAA